MTGKSSNNPTLFWVPVEDTTQLFTKAELVDSSNDNNLITNKKENEEQTVQLKLLSNGDIIDFPISKIFPVNPNIFDKVNDMSELTHLNEPSVLFNLENRYKDNLIYTYSGLFLVAINPYKNLDIYNQKIRELYHNQNPSSKENDVNEIENSSSLPPHIFNITENAYRNLLHDDNNQSILVTGESGAGKTENTKKILQYLASITQSLNKDNFETKILQSNPILESFGNSQTVRNNNSSRFGKFIKINFSKDSSDVYKIIGAQIDWYLLEKSRITNQSKAERNFHIFYELLAGLSDSNNADLKSKLLIESTDINDYQILNKITNNNDNSNFKALLAAFDIIGFSKIEVENIFKVISSILHIGNLNFTSSFVSNNSSSNNKNNDKQAAFQNPELLTKIAALLGIEDSYDFKDSILRPKSKAGREWVHKSKNSLQSKSILNALSRTLYENLFDYIVSKINENLKSYHSATGSDVGSNYKFISILDIAGFEIFEKNSFEQFCINYTNEKLQQFFNHHMFILEQNEYINENIEWDYINFGKDLQSTIDLIELKKSNPTGILPLLDEESIIPNSSDESFFQKLISNWDNNSNKKTTNNKFKRSKKLNSFILKHYAGDVEYHTDGWLLKNRDPLNDHLLNILISSENRLVSSFFNTETQLSNSIKVTTSSRHREQLNSLLEQLRLTNPHFIRCIIPNNLKAPKTFDKQLILDQLRCNGVLEGIRIAREGYPNRILFNEFFQRYKFLLDNSVLNSINASNLKQNCELLISTELNLDPSLYKVGNTKLFFKAGVLADLEVKIEEKLSTSVTFMNAIIKGNLIRQLTQMKLSKLNSSKLIGKNFVVYEQEMANNPWFRLYIKLLPLLNSSQDIVRQKKYSENVKRLEHKIDDLEKNKTELINTNELKNNELEQIRELLKVETKKLEGKNQLLQTSKNAELELSEKLEKLKLINDKLEISKIAIEDENSRINDKIKIISEEIEKYLKENKNLKEDNGNLLKNVEDLTEQKESLSVDNQKLLNTVKDLEDNLKNKEINLRKEFKLEKEHLSSELESLQIIAESRKKEEEEYMAQNEKFKLEIENLSKLKNSQSDEIKILRSQIKTSEVTLDGKLEELEKNCTQALDRLSKLVNENSELRSQISSLKNEQLALNKQVKSREEDNTKLLNSITNYENDIKKLTHDKTNEIEKSQTTIQKLSEVQRELETFKKSNHNLTEKYEDLKNNFNSRSVDEEKLSSLSDALIEQKAKNESLAQKLLQVTNENLKIKEQKDRDQVVIVSETANIELMGKIEELNEKVVQTSERLKAEIEQKKNLIAKLRFTETKLASTMFELQHSAGKIKKMKEIIKNANITIDLDKELGNTDMISEMDVQKLVLELHHIKEQLEIETKARYDAENALSSLENKQRNVSNPIQGSIFSRLNKNKKNEQINKFVDHNNPVPLKDRTNLPLPSLTNSNYSHDDYRKYEDEVRFHKLENYKLQEVLNDSDKKMNNLVHLVKQASAKETLQSEQISTLQLNLEASESRNKDLKNIIVSNKKQIEDNMKYINDADTQLTEYSHALAEAEQDVRNMANIIEKLKDSNSDKEKLIWDYETKKDEMEIKIQEGNFELKKSQDMIKLLSSELEHFKERLKAEQDKTKEVDEIEKLQEELMLHTKYETELKKEVSKLNYALEMLKNDSESKLNDLTQQNEHYVLMLQQLSNEKDLIVESNKEISMQLDNLKTDQKSLNENIDRLLNEKSLLISETETLNSSLQKTREDLDSVMEERSELLNNKNHLGEALKLQQEQVRRNEDLIGKLELESAEFKSGYYEEKDKNISLIEENQSVLSSNNILKEKIKSLEAKLADTSDKEAWLSKIQEFEELVQSETEMKYEEMKKNQTLEKIIEELKEHNDKQTVTIENANQDRQQFEEEMHQFSERITTYEKQITKQKLDLNQMVRENSYFENKVNELESEVDYWKKRFENLATGKEKVQMNQEELLI
ncbi:hypothetical protein Kpol_1051p25 [Vanderwaltozyma polyspora DSM 70294]|uniref:Myosin motor domain-containing protein n=1 Tax=Vanderwaltozyma polyspora (strain ATCC 22028 / DSM 70294 / BCRC 21397 / CBS 2163 / NBRC 10782 / NRRL Y-8283 / UCD 57-17) TaxID=436907 RepID=A7TMY8_VANPO|nr:uncharacterized protein Kpol_1051p25 [Vanderwaltozyma polyspora DSM 70294]EDO16376.1 hypothetical protein Kpol_1051p25 [Vanderwaltozyma polyspora DSM 70294]